jgi:glycosyltransferase involved in cell wall biosynthesis
MRRPAVLHCAERWVEPSEGFVLDVVRSTTATRAVVACRSRTATPPDVGAVSAKVYELDRVVRRLPKATPLWPTLPLLLAGVAVRERVEVLHCHFGYWAEPVAAVAARLHLPWSLALHGDDALVHPRRNPAVLRAYRSADLVVVPSQWLADRLPDLGIDPARVRVIPSGVDLSRLPFRARPPHDGPTVVTFVGRFVPKKGVMDAVEALGLAARQVSLRAVFVGHGPLEGELRARVRELGLDAEITDGSQPGAARRALEATDLVLTASKIAPDGDAETLGLVNIEALALGAPLVTTRSGGIPAAVPDIDWADPIAPALLVDEGDVTAMAEALVVLARDRHSWAVRGRAGRLHAVLHHELGSRTADLEAQFLSLAAGQVPCGPPPRPRATPPTVSVIMVTHNRRPLLEQALTSLSEQTYAKVQVVVVDNGCSDGSTELLATHPELTVLRSETNAPPALMRNAAAEVATGEVLAFTDDDCRPTPTWVEGLVAGLREGVSVVQGRTIANPLLPLEPLSRTQWTPAEYGLYETANIAYDARAFAAVGGFDEELAAQVARVLGPRFGRYPFGEDTDLAWRVRRNGGLTRFATHALVHHHVFPPDVPYLMRRSVLAAGFPLLVREVPELRHVFLTGRVLLGQNRARFLLAVAGTVGIVSSPVAVTLVAPYAWSLVRPRQPGRRARLVAAPVLIARDVVETVALAVGSVRARSLVM